MPVQIPIRAAPPAPEILLDVDQLAIFVVLRMEMMRGHIESRMASTAGDDHDITRGQIRDLDLELQTKQDRLICHAQNI